MKQYNIEGYNNRTIKLESNNEKRYQVIYSCSMMNHIKFASVYF